MDQIASQLRRADPDRFLTALFAPAVARDVLLALYAFNHELARAREVTREPHLALIRLQWWREVPDASLDRLRALGAGYAVAGQLRNVAAYARQGRCLLPADILYEHGLSPDGILANPMASGTQAVRATLARQGLDLLGRPEPCGAWVAAALPAVLGRRDLARSGQVGARGLADRTAVAVAALRRQA